MKPSLVGAIEAGGTKFVCAIGTDPQNIEEIRFPTTSPEETIQKAIDFFKAKEMIQVKFKLLELERLARLRLTQNLKNLAG